MIVAGFAAAGLLVLASLSKSWLVDDGSRHVGFGPTGMQGCLVGVACHITSNGDAVAWMKDRKNREVIKEARGPVPRGTPDPTTSEWFSPMGYISFGATMFGAVGLLVSAVLALRRERPVLPFSPARFALASLLVGLLAGGVFLATKPGWQGMVVLGWGFWIFAIGVLAGMVAAQQLAKLIRPPDPLDALIEGRQSA
jgi:hypothetical protein